MTKLKTAGLGQFVTAGLLAGGAIFLLVGSLSSDYFAATTVNGVALGMVYGALALALVLIYRATHVVNFAQGELAMLTTYIAYQLHHQQGDPFAFPPGPVGPLSYWQAFFATLGIAFVLGTLLQVVLIRPVQHRSAIATVIVTVGLFILIDGVVNWIWGGEPKTLPSPFGIDYYHLGSVPIPYLSIWTMGIVLASVFAVWALFRFTKLGLAMRAASLRPASASLAGVRVDVMLAIGWGLAAVLGAVAGLMTEPSQGGLIVTYMQPILVYAFAAAALGGLESPVGAIIGGIAIGVFQTLNIAYVPEIGSDLQVPFAFAVILVILLVKPTGLLGRRRVERV